MKRKRSHSYYRLNVHHHQQLWFLHSNALVGCYSLYTPTPLSLDAFIFGFSAQFDPLQLYSLDPPVILDVKFFTGENLSTSYVAARMHILIAKQTGWIGKLCCKGSNDNVIILLLLFPMQPVSSITFLHCICLFTLFLSFNYRVVSRTVLLCITVFISHSLTAYIHFCEWILLPNCPFLHFLCIVL